MDTHLRHALIELKRNDTLPIHDGQGRSVVVFRGLVWITQEGDRRDVFLSAGQSFTIDRAGMTLAEAVDDASLLVLEPDPFLPAGGGDTPRVTVRPLRQEDRSRVDQLIHGLSTASRRQRFHATVRELPAAWLDRLVQARVPTESALLATVGEGARELAVGEARYGATEGAFDAREFALVVADGWQRRGIGTRLLKGLVPVAERSGITRLSGDVLADNAPMLALAKKNGFVPQHHPDDSRLVRVHRYFDAAGKPQFTRPQLEGALT